MVSQIFVPFFHDSIPDLSLFYLSLHGLMLWTTTPWTAPQLVRHGNIDFLVADYLSEITMSLLTAARRKNPVRMDTCTEKIHRLKFKMFVKLLYF